MNPNPKEYIHLRTSLHYYCIISNIGAAPIKAPPRAYPIFSRSNCKLPWALELILGSA